MAGSQRAVGMAEGGRRDRERGGVRVMPGLPPSLVGKDLDVVCVMGG